MNIDYLYTTCTPTRKCTGVYGCTGKYKKHTHTFIYWRYIYGFFFRDNRSANREPTCCRNRSSVGVNVPDYSI